MNFFDFIKFNFLLFGFDVDEKYQTKPFISKIIKFWMIFSPILMVIGSIQIWIYFFTISEDNSTLQVATSFLDTLFVPQVVVGYLTAVKTRKSSIKLIQNIGKVYIEMTGTGSKIDDEVIVKYAYSYGRKFFIMMIGVIGLNALIILIKIIAGFLTNSDPGNTTAIYMWFPKFLEDSVLFVAVYNSIVLLLFTLSNVISPLLIFITSAYLGAAFDKLGYKLKEVLDETENQSFMQTKKKVSECVDFHCELIKLADESNRLFGPFNLMFLILISLGTCMLGIMIMVM